MLKDIISTNDQIFRSVCFLAKFQFSIKFFASETILKSCRAMCRNAKKCSHLD